MTSFSLYQRIGLPRSTKVLQQSLGYSLSLPAVSSTLPTTSLDQHRLTPTP
jgi:hypothetical protein